MFANAALKDMLWSRLELGHKQTSFRGSQPS